jgi:glutamine synthetase
MKKIVLLTVALALVAAGRAGYRTYESDVQPYVEKATQLAERVRGGVEANPVPIVIALGTFLLTVVYHKAKGKSFRESVEVAATRVTVVPAPAAAAFQPENVVLKRAHARATRTQLLADQIGLKNRLAKLPPQVVQAEKDACFAEKAVADAKAILGEKHKVRNQTAARLEALQKEVATGQAELAEIDAELKKLAEVI